MKKNGFTLIELLGTIIIIAIIAIITIPLVINVIEKARKGALKSSVYGIEEASNLYYQKYMLDDNSFRLLEFQDNEQKDEYDKLAYKGNIKHGFVGINSDGKVAICIDNEKYYASKSLDSIDVVVEEGTCTSEFDEDMYAFITTGTANYIGLRLNVKEYESSNNLPASSKEGSVAVITDTKVSDYYVGPAHYPPENPKEGMVWLIQNSKAPKAIITKNSRIGIAYVTQYISDEWQLKESYVYNNNKWEQLSYLNDKVKWEYEYTGKYQTFEAPYAGYYTVELWGAAGGTATATVLGGNGAYTKGDVYLNAGEEIYIYVGQQGQGNAGGWNGGGGATTNYSGVNSYGGGGATDVRTVATSKDTTWNEMNSLQSRIMVAGAGGGSSFLSGNGSAAGGSAGGLIGYSGIQGSSYVGPGSGGTQATGGTGVAGSFGIGGTASGYHTTGGGGAGWFGGGGASSYYSGGGGGSSYISGHFGCLAVDYDLHSYGESKSIKGKYFINTTMIDGQGYKWTNVKDRNIGMPSYTDGQLITGNSGNGYARITFKKFAAYTEKQYDDLYEDNGVWIFPYSGYYQTFTVPKTGTYKFELWGAAGGDATDTILGGRGAYTKGEISLTKGEKLYIYVGQKGSGNTGGWNGGGGAATNYSGINSFGGGGATDVRTIPTSSSVVWNDINSLRTRIMVAAGGGGSSFLSGNGSAAGGSAGGLIGYAGIQGSSYVGPGSGGTQTAGGTGVAGNFGIGGTASGYHTTGGGGAGWFGGGGASSYYSGGGGGSSFISGHNGCIAVEADGTAKSNSESYTGYKFTKTKMVDGTGYKWTTEKGGYEGMTSPTYGTGLVGNDEDGYAKITFIK